MIGKKKKKTSPIAVEGAADDIFNRFSFSRISYPSQTHV